MSSLVKSVVVVGSGVAAPMAALAVARAFGRLGVTVTWVEHGAGVAPHAALIAPPDIATLHRLLGLDEAALIERAAMTLNLGQQFVGWSGGEGAFLHAYGDAGTPFASLPFVQHWTRARQAGLRVALEDFCVAAAAAKQGRIGTSRQAVKHGYHLDAAGYAALLREACVAADVTIVASEAVAAERDGDRIVSLMLDDDSLSADLFIDAGGVLANGETVAVTAPCDRMIRVSMAPVDPPPLFARVSAHSSGWLTQIPLANRMAVEFAYDSRHMSDEAAIAAIGGGEPEAIGAIALAKPWSGNCVSIGGAAPMLDGAELLLLQLAIAQLVLLWPVDAEAMPEADIYNEELAGSRSRVGDFSAQHFRLNGRAEPFWENARTAPISPELSAKIELFAARGMFAHFNYEAHVEDGWALVMAGHGVVPRSFDPQADAVEDGELMTEFQRQLRTVAAEVRGMETHTQALARIRAKH